MKNLIFINLTTNTNKFTKTIDLIFKKYSKIDAVINCAYQKKKVGKKFEF